jgi:hypothetical protein
MSTFTKSMFDSIKDALTKEGTSNKTADIMRTRPGNSYEVRLLPNVEDPSKTFYHYFSHGWTSFATGQYVTAVSPTTWGDRDPIAEHRFKVYRTGSAEEKKKSEAVFRREQWLVNVYVINDPTNPENNDTVKILRYGKQLHKILMEAVQGEDADQFGERIFDLTENGSTFRIRCDKQGEFPTYVSSKFLIPGAVDGLDSPRIKEIYNSCHSLDETFRVKSYDELKQMLDEHYHCNESATSEVLNNTPPPDDYGRKEEVSKDPALDEEVPMTFDKEQKTPIEPDTEMDPLEDDKVKELLAGLDDV